MIIGVLVPERLAHTDYVPTFFTALVVVIPIAEIAVFALVADRIGILPTVAALLAISGAGAVLLVRQGVDTFRKLRDAIRRRERPTDELADAALIAVGAVLLLTPGFFTDALAFLIVIPPSRRFLRGVLRRTATAVAATRLGWRGKAAVGAKTIYDVRATKVDGTPSSGSGPPAPPRQLPSSTRPSAEDDSPDRG